jgi:tetratricopeptide (TPR) repeat protein
MTEWTAYVSPGDKPFDTQRLQALWSRLHKGDAEPWPTDPALQHAWVLFHNGAFQHAVQAGLALDDAGLNVTNKATAIYANYVERREANRETLLLETAARAEKLQRHQPDNPGAWYWQAYALGRYSQGISVAKALTQGLGVRIKTALETTIKLCPQHADAHLALATFHAEVIDKVGHLIGGMTYGADRATGLALFETAMALNPDSAVTLTEYANGLVMLEGEKRLTDATALLDRAAAMEPLDAMERLYVASARVALEG